MKYFIFVAMFLLLSVYSNCQKTNLYDSLLAHKLGADDYGMRQYVVAFLYAGPTKIKDTAERERIQMAHLKNIFRLAKEGKLIVAGPFLDNQELRGLFIFNVTTVEEAKTLTLTDPAVKAGVLKMDLHLWYGSAALMQIPDLHQHIQKKSIAE